MTDKINVHMVPNCGSDEIRENEGGIRRVVENYCKYLPKYGINFVDSLDRADVVAIHAAYLPPPQRKDIPLVSILHGMYWIETEPSGSLLAVNATIASVLRRASQITVPSNWVAETIRRDLRVEPNIIPHGVDWKYWQHKLDNNGHILWNKNRTTDVCSPEAVHVLASRFPSKKFVATIAPKAPPNVVVTGVISHKDMMPVIQSAGVYLSTVKETFGIGVLEAMASGVPVLGFAEGGNIDLVTHKVNGYLARPGDYDDLSAGLVYCENNRNVLGNNGREIAKMYTWDMACRLLRSVFDLAVDPLPPTVAIVIPTYNYGTEDKLGRAIQSASHQIYPVSEIIVIDDGTKDEGATKRLVEKYQKVNGKIRYLYQENQGVAEARNNAIKSAECKYICCLDADDAIAPSFISKCVDALEKDLSLGIAYTGLTLVDRNWNGYEGNWPMEFDYDKQVKGHNQVPTCCVFRKDMWARLGGYKSRYAPGGAGAEDAEFWLRAGAYGFNAQRVTEERLFLYSYNSGATSSPDYKETDWLKWHPWVVDNRHPFASLATPQNISHPARQYDKPAVSVIIPVGKKHTKTVRDALDSLEAQSFRYWEAIIVDDTGSKMWLNDLLTAYPYVKIASSNQSGAGAARNAGAKIARASLFLFLDADDWLEPDAISSMVKAWLKNDLKHSSIIYTDYLGKAFIPETEIEKFGKRVLDYNRKTKEATILHRSFDYDASKAVRQPDKDMYIWSLITSLVPRSIHNAVGGFDETMRSWEDWDYWIRIARLGVNFHKVAKPLVVYRFYTGTRRQDGLDNYKDLLGYMIEKYSRQ